jgi:hypothetical protein
LSLQLFGLKRFWRFVLICGGLFEKAKDQSTPETDQFESPPGAT